MDQESKLVFKALCDDLQANKFQGDPEAFPAWKFSVLSVFSLLGLSAYIGVEDDDEDASGGNGGVVERTEDSERASAQSALSAQAGKKKMKTGGY